MEDDEDFMSDDEDNGSSSFSVNMSASMPSNFAVTGLPGMAELQKENERIGTEAAASLGKRYDDYASLLRAQRVGSTKKERIIGALAAFAQPNRSLGGALSQSGQFLASDAVTNRKEQEARDLALAKLGFDRDTAMAKLQQAYGIQGLRFRMEAAKAGAKGGGFKAFAVQPDLTHGPRIMIIRPDATTQIFTPEEAKAQGLPTENLPPAPVGAGAPAAAAGPGAVPPPPAGPTAAEGAGRGDVAVGQTYIGPDGATYIKARPGAQDQKIAEPSPEFTARAASLKKGGEEQATKTVETQTELEKSAREAQPVIVALNDAKRLIDSGLLITGTGAKERLAAQKLLALGGDADAKAKVTATEQYINMVTHQLGPTIKQFGSGTAISDSDRAMAERMVGADIALEDSTLAFINDKQKQFSEITMKQAVRPDQAAAEKQRRIDAAKAAKRPPLSSFRLK